MEAARARLASAGFAAADVDAAGRVAFFCGSFAQIGEALASLPSSWTSAGAAPLLDGVLLDSGLSAAVRGQPWRGLSFRVDGPLDMRVGSAATPAPAAAAALRAALAARAAAGEAAPAADADVDGDAAPAAAAAAPATAAAAAAGEIPVTAAELVSSLDVAALAGLVHGFGGLEPSRAIAVAQAVVRWRGRGPRERRRIASSLELRFALEQGLAALDGAPLPGTNGVLAVKARRWATRRRRDADLAAMTRNHPRYPAETGALFAALRMAVNGEIEAVSGALAALPAHLAPGAAVAALTFQPAEDAVVEAAFAALAAAAPLSASATAASAFAVESGAAPVRAAAAERRGNPRAAAARLRVLRRQAADASAPAAAAVDAAWLREAQASVATVLEAVAAAPQLPAFALAALEKAQAEAAARAAARAAQAEAAAAAAPAAAPAASPAAASRAPSSAAAGSLKVVQANGSQAPRAKAAASAGAAQSRPRPAASAGSAAEPGAAELAAFRAAAAAAAARRAAAASSGAAAPARGGISLGRSGASSSGFARASHARALHTTAAAGVGRRRGDAAASIDARAAAMLRGGRGSASRRAGARAADIDVDDEESEEAIAAMVAEIRRAGSGGAVGAAHASVPAARSADALLARIEAGEEVDEADVDAAIAGLRAQIRAAEADGPDVIDADAVDLVTSEAADAADVAAERLGLSDDAAARAMDEAMARAESQLRRGVPLADLEDAETEELLQADLGGVHGRRYRREVQEKAAAAAGAPPSDLWIDDALELAKLGTMEAACIAVQRAQTLAAVLADDYAKAEVEVLRQLRTALPAGQIEAFVARHVESDAQAAALEGDPDYEARAAAAEAEAAAAAMLRFGALHFPDKTRAVLALRIAAAAAAAKAKRLAADYAEDVAVGRGHFHTRLDAILAGTYDSADGVGSELRAALAARHHALEPLWRLPQVRASLEQRGLPLEPIGDEELRQAALELHVATKEVVDEPALARVEEDLSRRLASAAAREPALAPLIKELTAYAAAEGVGLQDAAVMMTAHAFSAARQEEELQAALAEPSDPNKPESIAEAVATAMEERGSRKAAAAAAAGAGTPKSADEAIEQLMALLDGPAAKDKDRAALKPRAMALLQVVEAEHGRQEDVRKDVEAFCAAPAEGDDDGDGGSALDSDDDEDSGDVPSNMLASLRRLQGESGVDQSAVAEVLSLLDIEGAGAAARMHADHEREVATFRAEMEAGARADLAALEASRASGADAEAAEMSPEEWAEHFAAEKEDMSALVEHEVAKYARQLAQQRADFMAERREELFGEGGEEDDGGDGARGDVSDSGSDDDDDEVDADGDAAADENAGFWLREDSDDDEAFVVGPAVLRALGVTRRQLSEDVARAIAFRKRDIGSCATKDEEDSDDDAVDDVDEEDAIAEREDGKAAWLAAASKDADVLALAKQLKMRPAELVALADDSDEEEDEEELDLLAESDAYTGRAMQRLDAQERAEAAAAADERRLAGEVLRQLRALPASVDLSNAKHIAAAADRGLFTPAVAHALGVGPHPDAARHPLARIYGDSDDGGADSDEFDSGSDAELLGSSPSARAGASAGTEGKVAREGKRPAATVDEAGRPLHPAQVLPLPRMRGAHAPPKLPLSRPGVSAGLIAKLDFMEDKPASLAAGAVIYSGKAAALNEGAGAVKRFDPHASIEALAAHNPLAASTAGVQFPLASLAKVSEAVNFDVGSAGRRAIASAVHRRLLFQQERAAGSQARRLRTLLMRRVGVSRTAGTKLSKAQADALAAYIVARRNEDPVLEDARSSASRARATASPVAVPHNPPRSHVLGGVGAAGGAGAALAHLPAGALPRAAALTSAYNDLNKRSEMRSGLKEALLRERRIKEALEKRRRPTAGRFAARSPAASNNYGYGPDSAAAGGAGQLK